MRSRMKWGDAVIIGAVLLVAAALAAVLAMQAVGDRLYAEVWKDSSLVERVALEEQTDRTIELDGHNTVVLLGKTAKMQYADCRDQVCVRTGTLTRAGQVAVCLPNRVVLKITGGQSDSKLEGSVRKNESEKGIVLRPADRARDRTVAGRAAVSTGCGRAGTRRQARPCKRGDPVCADKTFGAGRVFYFGMPRDDFLGTDGERDRVSVFPAWGAAFLGCHVPAAAAGRAVLLSAGCQCGRGGGT